MNNYREANFLIKKIQQKLPSTLGATILTQDGLTIAASNNIQDEDRISALTALLCSAGEQLSSYLFTDQSLKSLIINTETSTFLVVGLGEELILGLICTHNCSINSYLQTLKSIVADHSLSLAA